MNSNTVISVSSVYLLVGFAFALAVINSHEHKKNSFFQNVILFFTMLFLWLPGLLFPVRQKSDLIEKLDVGNPIGNFNLTAKDAPVYPEGSFSEGTSKLTVIDFDQK